MVAIYASYRAMEGSAQSSEVDTNHVSSITLGYPALAKGDYRILFALTPQAQNNFRKETVAPSLQEPLDSLNVRLVESTLVSFPVAKATPLIRYGH
jgi:hypothetical protein